MNKDIVIIFSEKKDEIVVNLKDKINIQVANNPTGELNIVENGKYDVTNYATANVNIPIPEGLIIPYGTIDITTTEEVDVGAYKTAKVVEPNLKPENIAKDVNILGIVGTFKGGIDTSNATATANDILLGKTAYVGEGKVEGTIETYDYEGVGGSTNTLKTLLDATKSTNNLFYNYPSASVDDLIKYGDTENVTNMSYMFKYCRNLQTIPQLNTSNVTSMYYMFEGCSNLQTIPQLDTSKVTGMSYMFCECGVLQTIPQLDTSNATTMESMFEECNNLQTIPQLNTSKVRNITDMFYCCPNLRAVDFTSIDEISSTYNIANTFNACHSLTKIIIRTMTKIPVLNTTALYKTCHFTGTVHSKYNPEGLKDGRIYVPDDYVDQLKEATNWSEFADCIVPLSTLEE